MKTIDFFREDKREIFFLNNINDTFTNLAFKNELKQVRNTFNQVTKEESKNRKKIEEITQKIKSIREMSHQQKYARKYIDTVDIIEEDEHDGKDYSSMMQSQNDISNSIDIELEDTTKGAPNQEEYQIRVNKNRKIPSLNFDKLNDQKKIIKKDFTPINVQKIIDDTNDAIQNQVVYRKSNLENNLNGNKNVIKVNTINNSNSNDKTTSSAKR